MSKELMTTPEDALSIVKQTEAETLATFQQEIPSIYFSHKGKADYEAYVHRAEVMYRNDFKFPPKMFEGAELIDFGAGTGENTIYLANWGARCTLVEMNHLAQKISKDVFAKYAKRPDDHVFVLSSIFDYAPNDGKLYDIVHSRGVLSHTAAKEEAFRKISTFLKPGGFLIFGDPNKAGGFQNMLQRYAVYSFAQTPEEMVDVCELLFKEDIDRSERAIPRTRRAIIFDRWVIQSQDDPSLAEVVSWVKDAGLQLYSTYPAVLLPQMGDSSHHQPKFDPFSATNLFPLAELAWMMQTESDSEFVGRINGHADDFANAFSAMTRYVQNLNAKTTLDLQTFKHLSKELVASASAVSPFQQLHDKLAIFAAESCAFLDLVKNRDLAALRQFIEGTEYLFKGACGVRHVDFVAHKPVI